MRRRLSLFIGAALLMIPMFSGVAIAQAFYCECEIGGGCDEYISRVTVADLDNPSSCEGFGNFTSLPLNMELGHSYLITIEIGAAYSMDSGAVWIDWEFDCVFDHPKDAVRLDEYGGYGPYYGTVHVPGHLQRDWIVMRVRLCYNETPHACGITTYGEVEDYIITLSGDPYVCGDASGDDEINLADGVYVINYVFRQGPAPDPMVIGDANCDDDVNVADAVYYINYVFKDGPEPCCHYGEGS